MDGTTILLGVFGLGGCAAAAWLAIGRGRIVAECARERATRESVERERDGAAADVRRMEEQLGLAREAQTKVSVDRAGLESGLEAERAAHAVTRGRLGEFDKQVREAFGTLAAEALAKNREQFLALAEQKLEQKRGAMDELVRPIKETLAKTDEKLAGMEKDRASAYAGLMEQVRAISESGSQLRSETAKLVRALREPQVRGMYGQVQLKRVAELAGMKGYCDFVEQSSTVGEDGSVRRPDMIVRLPNGRELVVDAKANLKHYLEALEAATPEAADVSLGRFADGVVEQARRLAKKGYYGDYAGSPEFVIMFVPGDQFVDAALAKRPDLLEIAASQRVLLASPSSLIGMLRAVAVGFTEQRLSEEAKGIRELVGELHKRLSVALEHADGLGTSLRQAVDRWNKFAGSVDGMLLPQLRRIEESGISSERKPPELATIVAEPRALPARTRAEGQNGEEGVKS